MAAIAKGGYNGPNSPAITVYTLSDGILADAYSIEYQIFDVGNDTKAMAPVQVLPTVAGQRSTVNLVTARISEGHYAPEFTIPITAVNGKHVIRWFAKMSAGDSERRWEVEFDVLQAVPRLLTGYALISDMREEGISEAMVSDARLMTAIEGSSKQIESWTRQWFEPRACSFALDNKGVMSAVFNVPIITIDAVSDETDGDYDLDQFVVYNRHITYGLTSPDDRRNPRIEWSIQKGKPWESRLFGESRVFPFGNQNLIFDGLFGFTEADGSFVGRTPDAIRLATKLLTLRKMVKLGSVEDRFDAMNRYRLKKERTRDQEYELGPGRAESRGGGGPFTGDPEIDDILLQYRGPIQMGSTAPRLLGGQPLDRWGM